MRVLVVEDETPISRIIKRGLENEGYEVDAAKDGEVGLKLAQTKDYDLILLDLMLPKVNGIEVCKTLRQKKIKTPIVILSARDTADDRAAGMKAGADDYLVKPFVFMELVARIRSLVRSRNAKEENNEKDLKASVLDIKDSHDLYKRILDNAPISIITIDKKGFITSANRYYLNFSRTKDYRNHNIFDSNFFIREKLIDDYKQLFAKGTVVVKENCYEKNNRGEDKYLKIIAVPLRDKDGEIDGALSMAVDNTEAVLIKKRLEKLNSELKEKIRKNEVRLKNQKKC